MAQQFEQKIIKTETDPEQNQTDLVSQTRHRGRCSVISNFG